VGAALLVVILALLLRPRPDDDLRVSGQEEPSASAREPAAKEDAEIDRGVDESNNAAAVPPAASPARWLGYLVRQRPAECLAEIRSYTNVVVDHGWPRYGDELIRAARASGLKVVLIFLGKERSRVETEGFALARANRDVVSAMCWADPFVAGHSPSDLAAFGRDLKQSVPGIEFWGSFAAQPPGAQPNKSVPEEIDVLMVYFWGVTLSEQVRSQADAMLPVWLAKARGRPVLLSWTSWDSGPPGLVPRCGPDMLRALGGLVEENGLAGAVFDDYGGGSKPGFVGIDDNPRLVSEIKQIAERWRPTARFPDSPTVTADEGFVDLFSPRTLESWQGAPSGSRPADGLFVYLPKGRVNLFSAKTYADFILRFEFKLEPGGNSGVAIRSPPGGNPAYDGIEVQILDDSSPRFAHMRSDMHHGSIWGVAPSISGHLKPVGEWNRQEIVCDGRRLRVVLNDTTILDVDLDEVAESAQDGKSHPGLKRDSGHIGFFRQSPGAEFRNIRIKEL
jgi:hypothetical protein